MKLQIGNSSNFELRSEVVTVTKDIKLKFLFLSDFHFRKGSRALADSILVCCRKVSPDFVVLGGDYIESKKGLSVLDGFIKSLSLITEVIAIPGNHDYYFGLSKIQSAFENNGCSWIDKESKVIYVNEIAIQIDGNYQSDKLGGDINILCCHNPKLFNTISSGYDVALAGHLHGCQIVFWESKDELYPGALFYKWNGLRFINNGVKILVSKGLGDTIPIRYNCAKEVIEISIQGNSKK
mgnify:CR=1 FL=1|tara:strand:+ start:24 stop:737 length:714 start_codon:yes stop_codon:yes gene_type:complete